MSNTNFADLRLIQLLHLPAILQNALCLPSNQNLFLSLERPDPRIRSCEEAWKEGRRWNRFGCGENRQPFRRPTHS